jgi:4-hydroxy-2-oxoheptanedioate aldolase
MKAISDTVLTNTKGVRVTLSDPEVCSILSPYVDFFVLDPVASALSPDVLQMMLLVAGDRDVFVRAENADAATLQKYLNWGVDGLIIPNLHHAADVERALAACLYPPEGLRPYRPLHKSDDVSLGVLNDQVTLIAEVAHPDTVAQIESIAEVTGLDGLLISPKALSVAMELEGVLDHPKLMAAMAEVLRVAESMEVKCGFEDVISETLQADFHVLTSDSALLRKAAAQVLGETEEDDEQGGLRALR